jgi:hypothetical protein
VAKQIDMFDDSVEDDDLPEESLDFLEEFLEDDEECTPLDFNDNNRY